MDQHMKNQGEKLFIINLKKPQKYSSAVKYYFIKSNICNSFRFIIPYLIIKSTQPDGPHKRSL